MLSLDGFGSEVFVDRRASRQGTIDLICETLPGLTQKQHNKAKIFNFEEELKLSAHEDTMEAEGNRLFTQCA